MKIKRFRWMLFSLTSTLYLLIAMPNTRPWAPRQWSLFMGTTRHHQYLFMGTDDLTSRHGRPSHGDCVYSSSLTSCPQIHCCLRSGGFPERSPTFSLHGHQWFLFVATSALLLDSAPSFTELRHQGSFCYCVMPLECLPFPPLWYVPSSFLDAS